MKPLTLWIGIALIVLGALIVHYDSTKADTNARGFADCVAAGGSWADDYCGR